jgi:membrane fusion protein (multidrug efflux system)
MSTEDSTPATSEEEKAKPGSAPTDAKQGGDKAITLQPGSYTVKVVGAGDSKDGAKDAKAEGQKANDDPKKSAGPPWYRRPLPVGLIVLAVAVILVAGMLIWRHTRDHVTTDDAYVDGIPQLVSPQVAGRVEHVMVDDNQDVKVGQLLLELDASDYQTKVDQARAAIAQARAQLEEARAQQTVYSAQAEESKANLAMAEANATNAANQLGRYQRLKAVNGGAVSDQQMDSATAAQASTAAQLNAARSAVAAAEAQLGYSKSMITAARAGIQSADAQLAQADLTLSYTRVIARIDGRVANKNATEGTVVAAGTPLMAVVPRNVYVTANLKETQLTHIKKGQAVKVTVDAYPDLKLTGTVDSVEPASGQTFSALPAQNATGNWVKVVQRVEVKVVFDQIPDDPNRRLAPGMSVEISATVR